MSGITLDITFKDVRILRDELDLSIEEIRDMRQGPMDPEDRVESYNNLASLMTVRNQLSALLGEVLE